MADYNALVKSSFFQAKSVNEFEKFCKHYELEIMYDPDTGRVGFCSDMDRYPIVGIPNSLVGDLVIDEDGYEDYEIIEVDIDEFLQELSTHLEEGWAVEIQEIGNEKMRYLNAFSYVVRWDGEIRDWYLGKLAEDLSEEWSDVKLYFAR